MKTLSSVIEEKFRPCCTDGFRAVEGTGHYHEFNKTTAKHGGNAEISMKVNEGHLRIYILIIKDQPLCCLEVNPKHLKHQQYQVT